MCTSGTKGTGQGHAPSYHETPVELSPMYSGAILVPAGRQTARHLAHSRCSINNCQMSVDYRLSKTFLLHIPAVHCHVSSLRIICNQPAPTGCLHLLAPIPLLLVSLQLCLMKLPSHQSIDLCWSVSPTAAILLDPSSALDTPQLPHSLLLQTYSSFGLQDPTLCWFPHLSGHSSISFAGTS